MYPKLKRFQPKLITAVFFPYYVNCPEVINQGLCWEWAWLARKTFKDVELWDICEHAFVRHGNKFYDSERLLGEKDWQDLPSANMGADYLVCEGCEACYREAGAAPLFEWQFMNHWRLQAKRFHTSWQQLNRAAQQELRRHAHG